MNSFGGSLADTINSAKSVITEPLDHVGKITSDIKGSISGVQGILSYIYYTLAAISFTIVMVILYKAFNALPTAPTAGTKGKAGKRVETKGNPKTEGKGTPEGAKPVVRGTKNLKMIQISPRENGDFRDPGDLSKAPEGYSSGGLNSPGTLPLAAAVDLYGPDVLEGDIGGGLTVNREGTFSLY